MREEFEVKLEQTITLITGYTKSDLLFLVVIIKYIISYKQDRKDLVNNLIVFLTVHWQLKAQEKFKQKHSC